MAERIVDPAEILRGNQQQRPGFDTKIYSNLSIPSYVHGYSLAVEYAKDWFTKRFNPLFFKPGSVHVNEKNALDDYRKLSKAAILKKEKPVLIITPQLSFDFNLENVHMYNYGPDIIVNRGWQSDSFYRDSEKGLYMKMNMQLMEVRFNYKLILYSRAQQMDIYNKMLILFRIGATQGEDKDLDFHIPSDIMVNLAHDAGFDVDPVKKIVKEPIEFVRYMNRHSSFPILYKMRNITGNNEYFMRVPSLYVHTDCTDRLTPDDGEMNGQLRTDYGIEMSTVVRMPVPQFYVYYTSKPIEYDFNRVENDPENILYDINTFKVVDIPMHNEKGWEKLVYTQYAPDKSDGYSIDLTELFGTSEFTEVMNITKSRYISPSAYIDIKVFNNDPEKDGTIKTHMDWETNTLIFDEEVALSEMLYISLYVDTEYYNNILSEKKNSTGNRMNDSSYDKTQQRYEYK